MPNVWDKAAQTDKETPMSMIGKIILLFAIGLFVVICITFIRLLLEDCDAVEIELREIEK
jgi:hypothetical protein